MIFIIWSGAAVAGDEEVVGLGCEVDVADLDWVDDNLDVVLPGTARPLRECRVWR